MPFPNFSTWVKATWVKTTFLVCQIYRVLNIIDGSRLNTGVRNIKEKNYFSDSFIVI